MAFTNTEKQSRYRKKNPIRQINLSYRTDSDEYQRLEKLAKRHGGSWKKAIDNAVRKVSR